MEENNINQQLLDMITELKGDIAELRSQVNRPVETASPQLTPSIETNIVESKPAGQVEEREITTTGFEDMMRDMGIIK